jgi:hypothetical protein
MQHVVASWIASTLTKIYADAGDPVIEPITIIAQDPMYIKKDRDLLSNLANPIDVVFDPQAFLAINSSSLVMSVQPLVPVKAIVADLDVLPAAMFWNQPWDHETYSTVDRVQIDVGNGIPYYLTNPITGRLAEMLEGYEMMTVDQWVEEDEDWSLEWLHELEMWVRKEAHTE